MSGKLMLNGKICADRMEILEDNLSVMTDSMRIIRERSGALGALWEGNAADIWKHEMKKCEEDVLSAVEKVRRLAMEVDYLSKELENTKKRVEEIVNGFGMRLI